MALIDVVDLSFAYEGSYDNVFEHVSFQIDTDWKLGLLGERAREDDIFESAFGKLRISGEDIFQYGICVFSI